MRTKAPAYVAIYNTILKKINKGEYSKEVPIPSENELATKYKVSRMTARKSVDMLVNEGYLVRFKGKGTFITGRKNFKKDIVSFTERMTEMSLRVYNEVKNFDVVKDLKQDVLDILNVKDEYVVTCERTRYINDEAAIFETVYIPQKFIEDATDEAFSSSLTSLLEKYAEVGSIKLTCESTKLKKKAAKQLNLKKDDCILAVKSTIYFMDGTVALYSYSYQNTDVLEFSSTIMK